MSRSHGLYSCALVYALLDLSNGLSWVETLRADLGAVHDLVTPVQLVGIIHLRHPLLCEVITGVNDPSASQADKT